MSIDHSGALASDVRHLAGVLLKGMVLKLYGVPVSQPVRAIIMALEMHNTPYELVNTMPGKAKAGGSKQ